jgi:hypothetical protein
MSAYATQLSEIDHHNLLQEALRQRDRAEAAKRRADALERALRQIRMRPLAEAHQIALDALTQQEPDQPVQDTGKQCCRERAHFLRMLHRNGLYPSVETLKSDQPAQHGEPSADQARFERVWQQLVYYVADFFALEITDAQAQSIARELVQAADAGEPSCCARTREALDRLRWVLWDAAPEDVRIARNDPGMNVDWQTICAAIRRTDGDTP